MFSLQETPRALEPALPPDAFDGDAAATLARDLAAAYPGATPGSEQDAALADAVVARFETFEAGELSEQRFSGSFDGDEVELRNLIMVLPGQSERQVALLAPRDSLGGSGAASGRRLDRGAARDRRRASRARPTRRRSCSSPPTARPREPRERGASHATTATPTCSTPRWCSAAPPPPAPARRS